MHWKKNLLSAQQYTRCYSYFLEEKTVQSGFWLVPHPDPLYFARSVIDLLCLMALSELFDTCSVITDFQ